jgi:hypothetical protein
MALTCCHAPFQPLGVGLPPVPGKNIFEELTHMIVQVHQRCDLRSIESQTLLYDVHGHHTQMQNTQLFDI